MFWMVGLALAGENMVAAVPERAMTVGKRDLVVGLEPGVILGGGAATWRSAVPVRIGVSDDLEVFMSPLLQGVEPKVSDPALGVLYRLTDGGAEVGLRVSGDLAFAGPAAHIILDAGVPVRWHASDRVAVDTGVFAVPNLSPVMSFGLRVPVAADLGLTDAVALRLGSGVAVGDLGGANAMALPAEAGVSWTADRDGNARLQLTGGAAWGDVRTPEALTAMVGARFFIVSDR